MLAFFPCRPNSGAVEPAPDARSENIADLIKAEKVRVTINGDSIRRLGMRIEKTTSQPLDIIVPAGTYFVCNNRSAQNMVSLRDVRRTLEKDSTSLSIPVACANKPKDIPTSKDGFTIGSLPNAEELKKLTALLGTKNLSYEINQAAVWIVTDNASYDGLGTLTTTTTSHAVGVPGFQQQRATTRTIKEPEAVAAMRLCVEAGIDIKTKTIWSDRFKILMTLPLGELKNWLMDFGGIGPSAHRGAIQKLHIGQDGKSLVSVDDKGVAKHWSLPDGAFVKTPPMRHANNMQRSVFMPDGKLLVTGDRDGTIKFWSFPGGILVKTLKDDSPVDGYFIVSVDGHWLVSWDMMSKNMKLWNLHDGSSARTLEGGGYGPVIGGSGGEMFVVAKGDHKTMRVWRVSDGALVKTLEATRAALFSPDGKTLATGAGFKTFQFWSLPDCTPVRTLQSRQSVFPEPRAFTPDGSLLVTVDTGTVELWDLVSEKPPKTLEKNGNVWGNIVISPDGKWLATTNNREKTINLWGLPDGAHFVKLAGHPGRVYNLAISPDSRLLASGDEFGYIKLWSLPDGRLLKTLEGE
jgi:WD40 repeat protein